MLSRIFRENAATRAVILPGRSAGNAAIVAIWHGADDCISKSVYLRDLRWQLWPLLPELENAGYWLRRKTILYYSASITTPGLNPACTTSKDNTRYQKKWRNQIRTMADCFLRENRLEEDANMRRDK